MHVRKSRLKGRQMSMPPRPSCTLLSIAEAVDDGGEDDCLERLRDPPVILSPNLGNLRTDHSRHVKKHAVAPFNFKLS